MMPRRSGGKAQWLNVWVLYTAVGTTFQGRSNSDKHNGEDTQKTNGPEKETEREGGRENEDPRRPCTQEQPRRHLFSMAKFQTSAKLHHEERLLYLLLPVALLPPGQLDTRLLHSVRRPLCYVVEERIPRKL